MTTMLLLGAIAGTGVWLLVRAITPSHRPLAVALANLYRPAAPVSTEDQGWVARVGRWLLPHAGGRLGNQGLGADLAVTNGTFELHLGRKALFAIAGLVLPPLMLAAPAAVGAVDLPLVVPGWVALAGLAGGFFAPDLILRSEAEQRRVEFRAAFGAFVDVFILLLAAGEGPEGAIESAARAGHGWGFAELRRTLEKARREGNTPWAALDELGVRFGVDEVRDLASTGMLASEEGARIRRSLVAKGRSMRAHTLAEEEAGAERANTGMVLPMTVLFAGFLVFIGYPAIMQMLATS